MNLAERQLRSLRFWAAREDARQPDGPLFALGVVSLGALVLIAGLNQTIGVGM